MHHLMDLTSIVTRLAARFGLEFARPEHLAWLRLAVALWVIGAFAMRRGRPVRVLAALLARTAAFVACILLLAGLSRKTEEVRPPSVIAAVDVSDSMGREGREWAEARARELFAAAGASAPKGVVLFARGSEMKSGLAPALPADAFSPSLAADATDISTAIASASLAFPPGGARRLVIFSDGNENSGDAVAAAARAHRDGVRIDCIAPPPRAREARTALSRLDLPEEVNVSEKFTVRVIAEHHGGEAAQGSLELRDGSKIIKEWPVTLQPGTNAFELPYGVSVPGTHRITAVLTPFGPGGEPGSPESVSSPLLVIDRPKILCVSGSSEGMKFLSDVLAAKDIEARVGGPEIVPATMDGLLAYDCVVLCNVPPASLGDRKMKLLARYVRDYGGGLVMLPGQGSFGRGGYGGTPVEEVLPVSMGKGVPFEKEKVVRLCVILVIDKSGSMSQPMKKIIAARASAEALVSQLQPNDMVGIIPFDFEYKVLVPLGPVGNDSLAIVDLIRRIQPGGDTAMGKPLAEALRQMASSSCHVKHVIVMTDGETKDLKHFDYRGLIAEYARRDITVSSIGIGSSFWGSDSAFLRAIAMGTGGDYYQVKDVDTLPMIVLADTRKVLDKSGFLERRFEPKFGEKSVMLKGIRQEQLPTLEGYMVTTAKRGADVALYTDIRGLKDPLLASWRRGLGKTVAWTSDAEGRWSGGMVQSKIFGKFWAQVVRWAMRDRSQDYYLARARSEGGRDTLELQAFSPVKEGVSFRIVPGAAAEKGKKAVALRQVAPDTWAAEVRGLSPSLDSVTVEKVEGGKVTGRKEVGLFRRAPTKAVATAESVTGPNTALLAAIARAGGGEVGPVLDARAFAPEKAPSRASLARYLFPLAFAFLLADIAVRKLWI